MNKLQRLGEAPVPTLLRELSIPAIIGMLVNALYNVVDRLYIGQGCGRDAIAGVALSFPFMAILAAFGTLIGVGSGALLSIKLGEKRHAEAEMVVGQCIAVKTLFFITLPIIILCFLDWFLKTFGATPEALPYAREYLRIILYGNIFSHLSFGMANMLRSEGQANRSMHCLVIGAVLNTILDPIFIFGFKMGVAGAAWATDLAMLSTAAVAFYFYLSGKTAVRLRWKRVRIFPRVLGRVFAIGLSPFLLQLMMGGITIAYNRMFLKWAPTTESATLEIAAMGIIHTLLSLFFMPLMGITQGMQPIVGYNYGAKNFARVRSAFALSVKIASLVSLAVTLTILIFAGPIARCFTNEPMLLQTTTRDFRLFSCMFFTIGMPVVTVDYYRSIGRAGIAIILSMMRQGFMLLPLILIFPVFWGVTGIWLAGPVSDLLSSIVTDIVGFRELRKLARLGPTADSQTPDPAPVE